jgi:hypothetical protein
VDVSFRGGGVVAIIDGEWSYEKIVRTLSNVECGVHAMEMIRSMKGMECEITLEALAIHITCTLLKGNEWVVFLASMYQNPVYRQYRDVLDAIARISRDVVRREAPHVTAVKAALCEEEKSRIIARRAQETARDRKERMALMGVFGGGVGLCYAGYGAAIGSLAGPVGTAVGAGVGGVIGVTAGLIFGANKT